MSGLFYSLKPTKFGFQLCAEGFSEKMGLLISSIVEAVYRCDFTADQLKSVLEVHRKALQSCAAEPLRNQSRYLLNALLSARVWTREQRLAAMENIDQQQVGSFGRNFLDSHSVECLFYGNISKQQVRSGWFLKYFPDDEIFSVPGHHGPRGGAAVLLPGQEGGGTGCRGGG